MSKLRLSIVTATYNASSDLPRLIESLKNQTDDDFEWVVADGGSTDNTHSLLKEAEKNLKCLVVDIKRDCGIYDALNRAVLKCKGTYYLIAGADDFFEQDAVANFKKAIAESGADMITSRVTVGHRITREKKPSWLWLYGPSAHISSHAIGIAIKKELHNKYGYYDLKYQIYADGNFMLKAIKSGSSVAKTNFVSGKYSNEGVSNHNQIISFSEQLRSQIENGSSWLLQLFVCTLRIAKWGVKGRLR